MDWRYLAVAIAGASAFIDMYATQPLLPELRTTFHASEAAVGATISALTFACALSAPFVGSLADRIGRKRVIVTAIAALGLVTLGAATAPTLPVLIAWRFAQGLFMPAVFAVTLANYRRRVSTRGRWPRRRRLRGRECVRRILRPLLHGSRCGSNRLA